MFSRRDREGTFISLRDGGVLIFFLDGTRHACLSTWAWHVPRIRGIWQADLCGIVGCRFRGERPTLREVGPPEQLQRDLRRPLAQPSIDRLRRLKKNRGHHKPVFPSLFAAQTTRAPTRSRLRSEVRSLYPRRRCPRGTPGQRSPPMRSEAR